MLYGLIISYWFVAFIVIKPPGAKRVKFVKFKVLIEIKDSISEIPVSDAPTTTILLLTDYFGMVKYFLLIMDKAKGLSS